MNLSRLNMSVVISTKVVKKVSNERRKVYFFNHPFLISSVFVESYIRNGFNHSIVATRPYLLDDMYGTTSTPQGIIFPAT